MTHPISYKTFFSAPLRGAVPSKEPSARQSTIQVPALGSTLRSNSVCLMSLCSSQTIGLGPDRAALVNPNPLSYLVAKGPLHTDIVSSAAQPRPGGEAKPPMGNASQPLPGEPLDEGGCPPNQVPRRELGERPKPYPTTQLVESLSVHSNPQRVALQSNAQPLDHRLLTGKLGGWGHGSPIGGGALQQPTRGGEVKAPRQKGSLPVATRALPGYLIKLVNQLMRHGKKGISVGLLADSLALFCKRLEEGRRGNLHDGGAISAVPPKEGNGQGADALRSRQRGKEPAPKASRQTGCVALQRTALRPQGVPSFPFYLASFPGVSSGEILYQSRGGLSTLLALPFSGALPPHFSGTRVSFVKGGAKHRGLVGVEASQWQALSPKRVSLNGLQSLNVNRNARSNPSPARAEVGLRFHTQRPIYFWFMEGRPSIKLHPRGMRGQETLPEASTLRHLGRAISNVEPSLEVRKKKIAGITRQIPCVVPKERGERLAIRWIINSARERVRKRGKGLAYCLAEELTDAYYKRGEPRQRRDSLHKAAESNRSFLRYRWW